MKGKRLNTESFIERSKQIHGEVYSYENVEYKTNKDKVNITCKIHGSFLQEAGSHLKGMGCYECGREKTTAPKRFSIDDVINKCKNVHGNKYDYSESVYKGMKNKMLINCPKHGNFEQTPANHIYRLTNCPRCDFTISKPEIEIQEFVKSLGFEIETNRRDIIKPYELDIYIPKLNKAIEFNGMRWHYDKTTCKKEKGYHGMKSNLCRNKNIILLHIREDLWNKKKDKIKQVIEKFIYE